MDSIVTTQAAKVISANGNVFVKVNGKDVPITDTLALNAGTEIFLPEGANALLSLEDGSLLPVGEQDSPAQDIFDTPIDDEIAAIQALIEGGADPTEVLEATAAGGNAASGAGSWGFQSIGRTGDETIAQAGFDTEAVGRGFATRQELRDTVAEGTVNNTVVDDSDPTTFTLSSTTNGDNITEGGKIEYKVELSSPAKEAITVTLSNGVTIEIPKDASSGTGEFTVRGDDAYTQGHDDLSVTIDSVTDNSFEDVTFEGTVNNTVVDDSDPTTFTLSSTTNGDNITEGGKIEYKVELSSPAKEAITVTLSNGVTIEIPKDASSGTGEFTVRGDDAYTQGHDDLSVTIDSVTDNSFEDVTFEGTVNNTVVDDSDPTTFTLSSTTNGDNITEGGKIEYKVELSSPAKEAITVTLSNGVTIEIPKDASSGTGEFTVRGDDAYTQGHDDLSVTIDSVTDNSFEDVTFEGTVNNTVVDDSDPTTFTLSSTTNGDNITEGGKIEYKVELSSPAKEAITVTLSNGVTIEIPKDASSGTGEFTVRGDDAYTQGHDDLSVTIDSVTDNSFEDVTFEGTVNNTVVDDSDPTTFTLSSTTNGDNITEGGKIEYKVELSSPAKEAITVTLSNGVTIEIPKDASSGTGEFTVRGDDAYTQGHDDLSVTIDSVTDNSFEDVTFEGTVNNTVVDDSDPTTFTLSSTTNGDNITEGGKIEYKVELSSPAKEAITVTLSNGVTIEIPKDASSGTGEFTVRGDDAYTQGHDDLSVTIDSVTDNSFEDVTFEGTVNNTVVDDSDPTTFTLSSTTNGDNITEGGKIEYKVELSSPAKEAITVTLSNGVTIEIPKDASSGTGEFTVRGDDAYTQGHDDLSVTIDSVTDNSFEDVTFEGTVNNTVVDDSDPTTFTLSSTTNGDNITEGGKIEYKVELSSPAKEAITVTLSNGVTIEIPKDASSGTGEFTVRGDDAYTQGHDDLSVTIDSVTDNSFEDVTFEGTVNNTVVDDSDPTTFTLSSTTNGDNITEGGKIEYKVELSSPAKEAITVTLSNGVTIEIPKDASSGTGEFTVRGDDAYTQGHDDLSVTIDSVTDNSFEDVTFEGTVNNTVVDDSDPTTFTLSSTTNGDNITEGGKIEYKVELSSPAKEAITVTLSNGVTIEIPKDASSGTGEFTVRGDDAYTQGHDDLSVTIDSVTDNSFEDVTFEGTVNNTVVDDSDPTTFTLSSTTNGDNITEGGKIEYKVELSSPAKEAITVTLSNGVTIEIPKDASSGTGEFTVRGDDAYTQGHDDLSVTIDSVTDNSFEDVTFEGTVNNTVVDDSDPTTFTLSSTTNGDNITEGGKIEYKVELSSPAKEAITVTLSNGVTIEIPKDASSGTGEFTVRGDDAYTQGHDDLSVTIDSVTDNSFEDVTFEGTVNNTVVDDSDPTTFTLSSTTNGDNITEGGKIEYKVELSSPAKEAITVTLSNGVTIEIPKDASSGTGEFTVRGDDAYTQGHDDLSVTIDSVTDNSFEDVTFEGTVNNTVVDDSDTVTVKLFAADDNGMIIYKDGVPLEANSTEEGGDVYYVAQLVDSNGDIIAGATGEVTINFGALTNADGSKDYTQSGTAITVNLGDKITAETLDDHFNEGSESFEVSVSLTDEQKTDLEGTYEKVTADGSVTTTVNDEGDGNYGDEDTVTVKLFVVNADGSIVPAENGTLTEGDANGDTIQYMALPVDANGTILATFNADGSVTLLNKNKGQVTVTVEESDDSAASNNTDVTTQGMKNQTVSLGQVFEVSAVDDHFADNGETVTITLGNVSGNITNTYEEVTSNDNVTNNIIDNDNPPVAVDDYKDSNILFQESFEIENGSKGWVVVDEFNGWNITNGLEIQTGNVGGSTASDGNSHAEFDSHGAVTSVEISRVLDAGDGVIAGQNYTLSFDFKPRPNHEDDSDMLFTFGEYSYKVIVSENCGISFDALQDDAPALSSTDAGNGWTTISVTYQAQDDAEIKLAFTNDDETTSSDTFGAYIDNIEVSGPQPYWVNNDKHPENVVEILFFTEDKKGILDNDFDTDNDDLSAIINSFKIDADNPESVGKLSFITKVIEGKEEIVGIRFIPNEEYNGPVKIQYQNTDGANDSNVANIHIYVNEVNANDDGSGLLFETSSEDGWQNLDGNGILTINAVKIGEDGKRVPQGDLVTENSEHVHDKHGIGVADEAREGNAGDVSYQVEYDHGTNTSEALELVLTTPADKLEIGVARLFDNEHGQGNHEVAKWTAYDKDGKVLATGEFNFGDKTSCEGIITIEAAGIYTVVLEALPRLNESDSNKTSGDSSDFTITSVAVYSEQAKYTVAETETLDSTTTVQGSLLQNDGDPEGHSFSVTEINGQPLTFGDDGFARVTFDEGTLYIKADGTFKFEAIDQADLVEGQSEQFQFDYTIRDSKGDLDIAKVTITIEGKDDQPTELTVTVSDAQVSEEALPNARPEDGEQPSSSDNNVQINIGGIDDFDNLRVAFKVENGEPVFATSDGSLTELSSGGETIQWKFGGPNGDDYTTLIGFTSEGNVLTISLTQGVGSAAPSYSVVLHKPVAHLNSGEDTLGMLKPQIEVEGTGDLEGKVTVTGDASLSVSIDDDMVDVSASQTTVTAQLTQAQTNGTVNVFQNYDDSTHVYDLNGKTTISFSAEGPGDDVTPSWNNGQGLGVASSMGTNNKHEIQSTSAEAETLIGSLAQDDVAYNLSLSLYKLNDSTALMHGSKPVFGIVTFYKEGVPVASYSFDKGDVTYHGPQAADVHFDVPTGFDEFRITPTQGSDFTIKGVDVDMTQDGSIYAHASGQIDVQYGADGAGASPAITQFGSIEGNTSIYSFSQVSNTHWQVTLGSGAAAIVVGDLQLDASGSWSFEQLAPITEELNFKVVASDRDNDTDDVTVTIVPAGTSNKIETGDSNDTVKLHSGYGNIDMIDTGSGSPIKVNGHVIFDGASPGLISVDQLNGVTGLTNPALDKLPEGEQFVSNSSDAIYTYGGNDHVEGGAGDDWIYLGDSGDNAGYSEEEMLGFVAASESELFTLSSSSAELEDGTLNASYQAWADVAQGGKGNDTIFGEDGTDIISGGTGEDRLFGGSGSDALRGGSGDDILDGGTGNDWLRGDAGNDTLIGGAGEDVFVWGSADSVAGELWVDTAKDFNTSEDKLHLTDLLVKESGDAVDISKIVSFEEVGEDGNKSLVLNLDLNGDSSVDQKIVLDGLSLDNGSVQINTLYSEGKGTLTLTQSGETSSITFQPLVEQQEPQD
ncbi:retention module-containing protein [Grimontia hollisae]|uniref:retention module-containing protein n=1 Tax=Grimontia hollisae TaxID=673 RepID=UPI00165DB1EE|nr:retention module-containing protein [Grimontia hollisae]